VTTTRAPGGDLAATEVPAPQVSAVCVDDDTLIREGVARLLVGLTVVATFARVEALLESRPDVDVVLLDLSMPAAVAASPSDVMQGVQGVAAVAQAGYRVLIYTNERRREVLAGCLAAGANGVVHKSEPLPAVVEAARQVAAGQVVITTALTGLAEAITRRGTMAPLSPRQGEVLRARARGESFKHIGARLHIAPKTAEEYMSEVTKRFAQYLRDHSAADLEHHLGVGPGDLLDQISTLNAPPAHS
jgi:DNA-binding NarL/FixJ family response regulator